MPLLVISPYAKKGFVDSTQYDHTSTMKFIETRWGLEPLTTRDAAANDLTISFDFGQEVLPTTGMNPFEGMGWMVLVGAGLVLAGGVILRRATAVKADERGFFGGLERGNANLHELKTSMIWGC